MEKGLGLSEIRVSWKETGAFFALIAFSVLPYTGTVKHGYFLMDDFGALHLAKGLSLSDLFDPDFYSGSYGTYGYIRPIGLLLWHINYVLYGSEPAGYFITDLLIHAVCTVLVCFVVASLAGDRKAGFLAGILFAILPAHAEVLNWLSCRYDLAATMFYIAGLLLYIRRLRGQGRGLSTYFLVLLLEAAAILSKEMAVTFPLALILYELFYYKDGPGGVRRVLLRTAPFFAVVVAFILIRIEVFHGVWGSGQYVRLPSVADAFVRIAYYFFTLLYGFNLDHPYHVHAIGFAMTAVFAVAVVAVVMAPPERKRLALFFICLMLVSFLPLINFTKITGKFYINARYMYLPSFAYTAFLGVALSSVELAGKRFKALAAASASVLVICYVLTLASNNERWISKSNISGYVLKQFKEFYPGSLEGFDITVLNFPENIFGQNYFIPDNLTPALELVYGTGEMSFTLDSFQNRPGHTVRYSMLPRAGWTRRVVIAYDPGKCKIYQVFDSRQEVRDIKPVSRQGE